MGQEKQKEQEKQERKTKKKQNKKERREEKGNKVRHTEDDTPSEVWRVSLAGGLKIPIPLGADLRMRIHRDFSMVRLYRRNSEAIVPQKESLNYPNGTQLPKQVALAFLGVPRWIAKTFRAVLQRGWL